MSVRLRRLQNEYEKVTRLLAGHERIHILQTIGDPPEKYIVEYSVKGLVEEGGEIKSREVHRAEIVLGPNYPKQMPHCTMLTPVFHPNIDHLTICTRDVGAASETLDQVIVLIGEMIVYQVHNIKSPRNGDAARWTEEHLDGLPLEAVDLLPKVRVESVPPASASSPPLSAPQEPESLPPAEQHSCSILTQLVPSLQTAQCANCGRRSAEAQLESCRTSHLVCEDCLFHCFTCRESICVLCDWSACAECRRPLCTKCREACHICRQPVCGSHAIQCQACARLVCRECSDRCGGCSGIFGREHLDSNGRCPRCSAVFPESQVTVKAASQEHSKDTVIPRSISRVPEPVGVNKDHTEQGSQIAFAARGWVPPVPIGFEGKGERGGVESSQSGTPGAESNSEKTHLLEPRLPAPVGKDGSTRLAPRPRFAITHEDLRHLPENRITRTSREMRVAPLDKVETSGKAIASFAFGLAGIPLLGIPVGALAVVIGLLALKDIGARSWLGGRKLAIAGIWLGVSDTFLWIVLIGIWISSAPR